MNNFTLQIKIQERLNKLGSRDYDNIECWQIAEAFNKGQLEWCRRQQHGSNIFKESAEQSTTRVDDLQVLLVSRDLEGVNEKSFFEAPLPKDYMRFNRIGMEGKSDCCEERPFVVYPAEEADADALLKDYNTKPSFDWAETFSTLIDKKVRIYTGDEFSVQEAKLTYYRLPKPVQFNGCMDPATGSNFFQDQICEFKDDIAEILVDEAVAILAGDIESTLQVTRNTQNAERNN